MKKTLFILNFLCFTLPVYAAVCAYYPSPEGLQKQCDFLQPQEPCLDKVFPSTPSPEPSPQAKSSFALISSEKLPKKHLLFEDQQPCFDLTEIMIKGGVTGTRKFFDDNKHFNVFTFITFHRTVMRVYKALGIQDDQKWRLLRAELLRKLNQK